ncbi:MAG: hypothetical protein NC203_05410, partial [Firmicutes bacterium]|nr:hypothetical protein [[Eubacterium] siraeum]MCM1487788.1 hypothetical protein [Bacillota bacterium]
MQRIVFKKIIYGGKIIMKMTKLVAALSAAALAVTSLSLAATAATREEVTVSGLSQALSSTAYEVQKEDGTPIEVKKGDTVEVTITVEDDQTPAVSVNGKAATIAETKATAEIGESEASTKLELTGESATVTAVKVTPAAEETTAATTTAEGDGDDPATAPTITLPETEQTVTLARSSWGEGATDFNYQANIDILTDSTVDAFKLFASDVVVKINITNVTGATTSQLSVTPAVASWNEETSASTWKAKDGIAFSNGSATVTFPKAWITSDAEGGALEGASGAVRMVLQIGTPAGAAFDEAPVVKYTFGEPASEGDVTTAATTTAAGGAVS